MKLPHNKTIALMTMTAAAVFVQSTFASSQFDAADAVTIRDLDGETYQNSLNIELLNDNYGNQLEVITNIASGVSANDARITGNADNITSNDTDIAKLTTSLIDVSKTAAQAWQWTRDNDGFVYQNQSRSLNNQQKIATQNEKINTQNAVIEGQGALITAHKSEADSNFRKTWALANYNNGYVVDAWNMTLANEERLKNTQATVDETVILLDETTVTANAAYNKANFNNQSIEAIFDWSNVADMEIDAMNNYLGVMPDDYESDTPATLYKHTVQGNIHLGAGAQVGDNPNPWDEGFAGYEDPNAKTGMTALGSNSRADADKSTSLGAQSKTYGANSVAIGYQSIANDDNTVSFGNDYQAAIEAVEAVDAVEYQAEVLAVEYQAEVLAVEAVEASEGVDAVDAVEYQAEVLAVEYQPEILAADAIEAVEGKAEILENNRRLTHVAAGTNATDAVNMDQMNQRSAQLAREINSSENRTNIRIDGVDKRITGVEKSAHAGIAISMATKVILPDPGKKFRITAGVASYEGSSALGINGAGRINDNVAVYFGFGTDSDGEHTAVQSGASYQW